MCATVKSEKCDCSAACTRVVQWLSHSRVAIYLGQFAYPFGDADHTVNHIPPLLERVTPRRAPAPKALTNIITLKEMGLYYGTVQSSVVHTN